MRTSNVALRLQPSLLEEARKVAQSEGVAVNQLINVAVAEKLSRYASRLLPADGGSWRREEGAEDSVWRRRRESADARRRIAEAFNESCATKAPRRA